MCQKEEMNETFLINTPLQRGEKMRERGKNRFNGFLSEW